jgi:hypothetical protein
MSDREIARRIGFRKTSRNPIRMSDQNEDGCLFSDDVGSGVCILVVW